ncbi:MAG TPA: VOC family protein [Limnochordia bacterium]|nr:VOC family protein [Limnochordia bacterium]
MYKFLHTRVRVSDFERSIRWYCDHLGFVLKSKTDRSPAGNHVCHLELPGNEHTLELTWSPDFKLNVQEDLMHFAIGVPDLIAFCDQLEKQGVEIWPDGWREKFSSGGGKMAFITDPDGYEVELLERK